MKTVACNAPYGQGGLGQHLAQVVEDVRATGDLKHYYAYRCKPGDDAHGRAVSNALFQQLGRYTPLRWSAAGRNYVVGDLFDRVVARRLAAPLTAHIGFGGKALRSFRRARSLGAACELVAANSHVDHVARRHAEARRRDPLEPSWLNDAQRRKTRAEYAMAEVIHVASAYTEASFLEAGVPAARLRRIHYAVNPRFQPPATRPADGVFRIVYVGSVTVAKGVPVLLDAFARLPVAAAELTLVGGVNSRGMRRYLAARRAQDPRIRLRPGDPLPPLQQADVCVHPSFEDGFAYAPMEALACGVPVIVTQDTGMKEHVTDGMNGYVVPTGDVEALVERLDHLHRHPLTLPSLAH